MSNTTRRTENEKGNRPHISCAYCGTEIEPRSVNQKYCSHRCACKASYHKRVSFESVTFTCSMCGKTVVTDPGRKDKRTRFCSQECEKKILAAPAI